mmetsp:Transcript_8624/g.24215  ORF Transcript_8624/g.24215 Transcript_8624/m.24215 type:complete len:323 (-) Transcript_8624:80-1048(-)
MAELRLIDDQSQVLGLQLQDLVLVDANIVSSSRWISVTDKSPLAVHLLAALGLEARDLHEDAVAVGPVHAREALELEPLQALGQANLCSTIGLRAVQNYPFLTVQVLAGVRGQTGDFHDLAGLDRQVRIGLAGLLGVHAQVHVAHGFRSTWGFLPRPAEIVGLQVHSLCPLLLPHHAPLQDDAHFQALATFGHIDDHACLAVELLAGLGVQAVDLDLVVGLVPKLADGLVDQLFLLLFGSPIGIPEAQIANLLAGVVLDEPEILGLDSHALVGRHADLEAASPRDLLGGHALAAVELLARLRREAKDLHCIAGEDGTWGGRC